MKLISIIYLLWWLCIYPGGQTGQNGIWTFKLNLTLMVKVNRPKTIGTLTKLLGTSGPHLFVLPWTGEELSRGETGDWHTHMDTRKYRRRQRQYPKANLNSGENYSTEAGYKTEMFIFNIDP